MRPWNCCVLWGERDTFFSVSGCCFENWCKNDRSSAHGNVQALLETSAQQPRQHSQRGGERLKVNLHWNLNWKSARDHFPLKPFIPPVQCSSQLWLIFEMMSMIFLGQNPLETVQRWLLELSHLVMICLYFSGLCSSLSWNLMWNRFFIRERNHYTKW